ncbi:hypothetical protein PI125_g5622 [Phytophthora idaei]|nr:hypothetical protein PI125_g5622 [Phytophthora idaei]
MVTTVSGPAAKRSQEKGAAGTTVKVTLPPIEGEFESWYQVYKLRTSNSIRDRNRETRHRAARTGREPELYDEAL